MEASYEDARAKEYAATNYWSCTENSSNNAWNLNFGNGNLNGNNNKYNAYRVRAVAAFGTDFERFLSSVDEAFECCMKGKTRSKQAVDYLMIAEEDIVDLAIEMWTGEYKPSTSTCFLLTYPKLREVFAAHFRDRIVHHWICLRLNPLFEERFTRQGNVSHNCRKGFGTKTAVESACRGMEYVSCHYRKDAWVFKGDLVSFFMSIDKHILWRLLKRFIDREYMGEYKDILVDLTRITVFHRPELDCVFNTNIDRWEDLPESKSLLRNEPDNGGPIGNITTQLFANFLLSYLDMYVCWIMRRSGYHYVRFVDDFLLICDDKDVLKDAIRKIEAFLLASLRLRLHKDKRYFQHVSHGVLFVGSYIKPGRIYLGNRTASKFISKVHGYERKASSCDLDLYEREHMIASINSYFGACKGRSTYNIRKRVFGEFDHGLFKYMYVRNMNRAVLKKKYKRIVNA